MNKAYVLMTTDYDDGDSVEGVTLSAVIAQNWAKQLGQWVSPHEIQEVN